MILVCLNYVIAKNKPTAGFLLRPPEGPFSLSLILSHHLSSQLFESWTAKQSVVLRIYARTVKQKVWSDAEKRRARKGFFARFGSYATLRLH